MNMIEMKHVVRFYGHVPALTGMNLSVPKGSVFGLLGENGSGKTTSIKMIMGALIPHEGSVELLGSDPVGMTPETRARVAYVADEMALPNWMKLREALKLNASYFENWDEEKTLDRLRGYELSLDKTFGTLSKGQQRRFILTLALAPEPEVLILDEPASGLDVAVRREFLDTLMDLANEREVTILLSSHILTDVERVVDHVAFMKNGKLVRQGNLEDMKSQVKRVTFSSAPDDAAVKRGFNILSTQYPNHDGSFQFVIDDFTPEKIEGLECRVEHLNLEELFLYYNSPEYTGQKI
jgi:ABC-2 type transport system ATP-binding protein